ncbi:hypothetical protein VTK56DRAFT_4005 [Thermocarpiscus australiensis]
MPYAADDLERAPAPILRFPRATNPSSRPLDFLPLQFPRTMRRWRSLQASQFLRSRLPLRRLPRRRSPPCQSPLPPSPRPRRLAPQPVHADSYKLSHGDVYSLPCVPQKHEDRGGNGSTSLHVTFAGRTAHIWRIPYRRLGTRCDAPATLPKLPKWQERSRRP